MAYFEPFDTDIHIVTDENAISFLTNLEINLHREMCKYNEEYDIIFSYIGSITLNVMTIIRTKNNDYFMSDIDSVYFSHYQLPLLENKVINKKIEINGTSIKQSIKWFPLSELQYIEDYLYLSSIAKNYKKIKKRTLIPEELLGLYSLNTFDIETIPYEILLPIWGVTKFITKIGVTEKTIIEAKYELGKGIRKIDDLFGFKDSPVLFLIPIVELDKFIESNLLQLEVILNKIIGYNLSVKLLRLVKETLSAKDIDINKHSSLKNEVLDAILSYAKNNLKNSRIVKYIKIIKEK